MSQNFCDYDVSQGRIQNDRKINTILLKKLMLKGFLVFVDMSDIICYNLNVRIFSESRREKNDDYRS